LLFHIGIGFALLQDHTPPARKEVAFWWNFFGQTELSAWPQPPIEATALIPV